MNACDIIAKLMNIIEQSTQEIYYSSDVIAKANDYIVSVEGE